MSRNAARAMRDLADCLDAEAEEMPTGMAFATIAALARAHRAAADRIDAWAGEGGDGPVPVPAEYREGNGAGRRK